MCCFPLSLKISSLEAKRKDYVLFLSFVKFEKNGNYDHLLIDSFPFLLFLCPECIRFILTLMSPRREYCLVCDRWPIERKRDGKPETTEIWKMCDFSFFGFCNICKKKREKIPRLTIFSYFFFSFRSLIESIPIMILFRFFSHLRFLVIIIMVISKLCVCVCAVGEKAFNISFADLK